MSIMSSLGKVIVLLSLIIWAFSNCTGQIIRASFGVQEAIDPELVPIQKGKLFGFVDRTGKQVIKPLYEGVSFFSEDGYAKINKLGLYGIIDKSGNEIVAPISAREVTWDGAQNAKWLGLNNEEKYLYNTKYVFNDKSKKIIFYKTTGKKQVSEMYKYDKSPLHDKIEFSARNYEYNLGFYLGLSRVMMADGGINFIDSSFNKILPRNLYDGSYLGENRFVEFDESNKARLIDGKGKGYTDFIYEGIRTSNQEKYFIARVKEGGYSQRQILIDINGEKVSKESYSSITLAMKDLFIVKDGKSSVINQKGDTITKAKYSQIFPYSEHLIMTSLDGVYQFIDKNGVEVSVPYSGWSQIYTQDASIGIRDSKAYLINEKGLELTELDPNSKIVGKTHDCFLIRKENDYFIYDKEGKNVLNTPMGSIQGTEFDNYIVVNVKGNKSGLYDLSSRKWIHPIGERKIKYIGPRQSGPSSLQIESDTEIITYVSSLTYKSIVEKQVKANQNKTISYNQSYEQDKVVLTFDDGTSVEYPKSDKLRIISYGNNQYYFEKGRSSEKIILDKDFNQISPTGHKVNRKYEIANQIFFELIDNDRNKSLIDINGKWIFEPKKRQSFSPFLNKYWSYSDGAQSTFLDSKFKPVSKKAYKNINVAGTEYIVANYKDSKEIDIYNKDGKLIAEAKYTDQIGTYEDLLIVSKSPNRELRSCIIDTEGSELICLPYSSITPVDKSLELFIVKDIYDFGVVDKTNKNIVDIKYKNIAYHDKISAFHLEKNDYNNDLIDINFKPLMSDVNCYFKLQELRGGGYTAGGEEGYIYFDSAGKLVKKYDSDLGRPYSSDDLFDAGLIKFIKEGQVIFADSKSGVIYE